MLNTAQGSNTFVFVDVCEQYTARRVIKACDTCICPTINYLSKYDVTNTNGAPTGDDGRRTVVKSNLVDQNNKVNQGNALYNWVQIALSI